MPNVESLRNHSHPHIFKFFKNAKGWTEMVYERWNEDQWEPNDAPELKLLKVSISRGYKHYNVCNHTNSIYYHRFLPYMIMYTRILQLLSIQVLPRLILQQ